MNFASLIFADLELHIRSMSAPSGGVLSRFWLAVFSDGSVAHQGAGSGVCAGSITYPIDTIRRRMQVDGLLGQRMLYSSALDCSRKIYASGGSELQHICRTHNFELKMQRQCGISA